MSNHITVTIDKIMALGKEWNIKKKLLRTLLCSSSPRASKCIWGGLGNLRFLQVNIRVW